MDKDKRGEIHITNNFNAPIGQHIDHVDVINFHMDGDGTFHFGGVDAVHVTKDVPAQLKTEEERRLMGLLVDAEVLSEDWQPKGLSGSERSLVAKAVCDRLEVNEVWKVFGVLWNERQETLRSYYNKAMNQAKSLDYQDKLKKIFG